MSMTCYVDLTVDITKLPNYPKIKQTSDLANAILRGGIDFGSGKKELTLGKTSRSNLIFQSDKLRRDQYLKDVEFFDIENKKRTYLFSILRGKRWQSQISNNQSK